MPMEFEVIDGKPTFFGFGYATEEAVQQCIDVFNVLSPKVGRSNSGVDKTKKDSLDVYIPFNYTLDIQKEIEDFTVDYAKFFQLDMFMPELKVREHINIQKYPFNGGYHRVHCEKGYTGADQYRELVWMTYLNDVPTGGETFWPFYQKKVKPVKGLTVIWPAYFTHIHHGIPALTTEKIIATGWLSP